MMPTRTTTVAVVALSPLGSFPMCAKNPPGIGRSEMAENLGLMTGPKVWLETFLFRHTPRQFALKYY